MRQRAQKSSGGWIARLAVVLLLAAIGADLAADLRGDVGPLPPLAESVRGPASAAATEPCVSFCVPDCFCCSRSVGAVADVAPPRPALASIAISPVSQRGPLSVPPVAGLAPLVRC